MTPELPFPPIEALLPHRGTMRLTDEVLAFSDESVSVAAHVDPHAWYADANGAMPAWIGIELMAQAIAAHVGLLARREGGAVRAGVLLGSRKYQAKVAAFARGARLRIDAAELLRGAEGHGAYECSIMGEDGVRLADAVIKVFQPGDFQSFIEGSLTA
jgi:predicted hotdog family 3-hydroxylacyl-ACP dehydratase